MPIISTVAFSLFTADITVLNKALIGAEQVLGWQVGGLPEPALGNVLATLVVGQGVAARGSIRRPVLRPAAVPVSLYTSNRQHLARWQKLARAFIALYVTDIMDDTGFT